MTLSRTKWRTCPLAIGLLAAAVAAGAAPDAPAPAAAPAEDIDPAAMEALDKMGAYLKTLAVFQVSATTEREEVLENGMKVQFGETATLLAHKPAGLRVEMTSDRQQRQLFFDGKEFTLYAPRLQFYATVPAPPTIGELVTRLDEKFDIQMPFVDLFRWGTPEDASKSITAAMDLGAGSVAGTTCSHYAYRQDGLDWQIWIQKGDFPLPRKLVLTTTDDDARPQYQATYAWNLAPSFNDAAFTFAPPKGANRIVLNEKPADAGDGK